MPLVSLIETYSVKSFVAERDPLIMAMWQRDYMIETMHQRLKRIREDRAIKQADAAEAVGIGRPFLSDIEGGKKEGSIKTLIALADFYQISLDCLVGRSFPSSGRPDDLAQDDDERRLLDAWRSISEEDRGALKIALRNAVRAQDSDAA